MVGIDQLNMTVAQRFCDSVAGACGARYSAASPAAACRLSGGRASLRGVVTGKKTVNTEPLPGALSTVKPPRWRLTICLTIASPRPVPDVGPLF